MNTSFDVNWIASSLIIYVELVMELNFESENCNFLAKLVLISFSTLFLIIFVFEAVNTCFLLTSRKFAAFLLKIKLLKNPIWRTCCETNVAIATALN